MKPDDFEKRLQEQPLRPIPAAWREPVLAAMRQASGPAQPQRMEGSGSLRGGLAALLWPCPQAWAGLAAVWITIGLVHLSIREPSAPAPAVAEAQADPQVQEQLQEQRRLLAELLGPVPCPAPRHSQAAIPQPRSQRKEEFYNV